MKKTLSLLLAAGSCFAGSAQTVTDTDGNVYPTVTIGTQVWMKENLRTTRYSNGAPIPHVSDINAWSGLSTGARCYYGNDSATHHRIYGALYNWYVTQGTANVCPDGWHVPTEGEWTQLENYLGGSTTAGGQLKETGTAHWLSPNNSATNSTNFTGLPGGFRGLSDAYQYKGENGFWWTSSVSGPASWSRYLWYMDGNADANAVPRKLGMSIRCIQNAPNSTGGDVSPVQWQAWPNPVQQTLTVRVDAPCATVSIWSLQGSKLVEQELTGTGTIALGSLAAGVYLLQVETAQGTARQKVVKQ